MTDPDFVWLFEDEPGQHNVEDAHAVHEVERNIDEELKQSRRFEDLLDDVPDEHDDRLDGNPVRGE